MDLNSINGELKMKLSTKKWVTFIAVCSLSFAASAENNPTTKQEPPTKQELMVKEDLTPPTAEGPLPTDLIPPLLSAKRNSAT